jgi:anti-sigma factor (TIGR02949 family)
MDASTPETPLACSEVVRALWEYLDGRAGTDLVQCIDHHLALCDGCRAHFDFEERLMASISGLRKEHRDPARLRAEVLKALRGAGLDGTRPPP